MRVSRGKAYWQEEKILEKIEKGEQLQLKDSSFALVWLEEKGFINRNRHIFVTEKGRQARQLGIKNYLEAEKIEEEILRHSVQKSKKRGLLLWASFLVLLLLFLVFAAYNFDLFIEVDF